MASLRAFTVPLFYMLVIFMLVSTHFVLGFPPFGEEVKGRFPEVKIQKEWKRGSNGESEESARQIPTGPDPLHHNHFPKMP